MLALAVPVFALSWWAACYLIGRDPARGALARAAAAVTAYAIGVAAWAVWPDSRLAQILLCVPALFWAGAAVALLPRNLPERRQIDVGWLVLSAFFLAMVVALPSAGRLVALAPLVGGLVLIWRFRDQVQPHMLPAALAVVAGLYALGLVVLLLPIDLGSPMLVIAAIGVDLMMLAFLMAVADALDVGERLRPDLIRSITAAVVATVAVGLPAIFTIRAADSAVVTLLQFVLVGLVMTGVGLSGRLRRLLDRLGLRGDDRLRQDRGALLLLAEALPRHRQRHRLIATRQEDFLRFTRQALDNYRHLGRLMRSPLTDLPAVDKRLAGATVEQAPVRALELRAVLAESIDRLRPAGAFATSDEWRHYNALHFCVVLGLNPYGRRRPKTDGLDREARQALDWMRRYVPRRTLRRWQAEGASIVARRLWDELTNADPRWLTRARAS
ncbi:hypothetical protein Adu01nite_04590 [Paractinoplanes durhamensis]|uniref:FUSC family protein n=1 Tax=Paractinoplanes durhamensis TaxID=113563 RepID=A0ABQ3YNM1_9ACTN|nr:hypothetical protein Adu01nite_04590 [Actinoplanes durhamensis]